MRDFLCQIRWRQLLAAFVLTAVLGFGLQTWWQQRSIAPLKDILRQKDYIDTITVENRSSALYIETQLQPGTPLKASVHSLRNLAVSSGETVRIVLLDQADDELETLYAHMQFVIEDSIMNGTFLQMKDTLHKLAAESDVQCNVELDRTAVYVSLWTDSSYLYEIVPRTAGAPTGVAVEVHSRRWPTCAFETSPSV